MCLIMSLSLYLGLLIHLSVTCAASCFNYYFGCYLTICNILIILHLRPINFCSMVGPHPAIIKKTLMMCRVGRDGRVRADRRVDPVAVMHAKSYSTFFFSHCPGSSYICFLLPHGSGTESYNPDRELHFKKTMAAIWGTTALQ